VYIEVGDRSTGDAVTYPDDIQAMLGPAGKRDFAHQNDSLFPPFSFMSRPVPIATDAFDFEHWKQEPSGPIILRGAFADWPLFRNLKKCSTDHARLHYLSSRFGDDVVAYTKVRASDPFMGYDEDGKQNFKYAPANCKLSEFCALLRTSLQDPDSDVLYARGGANSLRKWRHFSKAVRPLSILRDMKVHDEGIWLGSGRHTTYLHHDAHFNFFAMVAGIKRVLLYPLEAIADLYPTPFQGGIAGTTSSFVRPLAPDHQKFPRFTNAAKHSLVVLLEEGDLLCLPPCWWHHVEAAPGLNLMINAFVWALPPTKERQFEVLMRKSVRTALRLPNKDLISVRHDLYHRQNGDMPVESSQSGSARALSRRLSRFLQPEIPAYWQKIAWCYYDHYIFQLNGHPCSCISRSTCALGKTGSFSETALPSLVQIPSRFDPNDVATYASEGYRAMIVNSLVHTDALSCNNAVPHPGAFACARR
jgi:hypothetical protein